MRQRQNYAIQTLIKTDLLPLSIKESIKFSFIEKRTQTRFTMTVGIVTNAQTNHIMPNFERYRQSITKKSDIVCIVNNVDKCAAGKALLPLTCS